MPAPKSSPGFEVFNPATYSAAANAAWIQANIQAGNAFLLVSSITELNLMNAQTGEIRGFGNEISQILAAGYQWSDGFLVPGK
jgi:hypothetical protein